MHEKTDLDCPDFDRLINQALGTYANVDSGLEQRVLARIVVGRASAPRLRRIVWASTLTAAACLLILMVLIHARPARSPVANAFNRSPLQQVPNAEARFEPRTVQRRSGLPHHTKVEGAAGKFVTNRLPKRDFFPTPQQLSPAEQVLVDFAARAPKAEREAFVDDQKHAFEPIAIAAIRITPIQIPPLEQPHTGAN
jgi:hypothetical protein